MSIFSQFAKQFALPFHDDYFADEVTLADPTARQIQASVGKEKTDTRTEGGRELRVTVRNIRFVGLTTLRHDATVTIAGVLYSIDSVGQCTSAGLEAVLRRVVSHDISRQNYSRK